MEHGTAGTQRKRMSRQELEESIRESVMLIRTHKARLNLAMGWRPDFSKVECLLDKAESIAKSRPDSGKGSVEVDGVRRSLAPAEPKADGEEYGFLYSKYAQLSRIEKELFRIIMSGKIGGL